MTLDDRPVRPYLVIAGADDGPDGRRVIEAAASSLANRLGGELHILHLSSPSELRSAATLELLEHGRASLDRTAADMHEATKCRVFVHIRPGTPWREIVAEARRLLADLVVVGTHGRQGAARLLLGSQGEQVLRHAPCAVLVVRDVYPAASDPMTSEPPCPECARGPEGDEADPTWCPKHAGHGAKDSIPVAGDTVRGPWVIRS